MFRLFLLLSALSVLLIANDAFAFGGRKIQVTELNGVTESQVHVTLDHAAVMIRGKGAELLFRMLEKKQQQTVNDTLHWIGNKDGLEWTVKGQQVICSKLVQTSTKIEDYACTFDLDVTGTATIASKAFNTSVFNLVRTETHSKFFQFNKRRVASMAMPWSAYGKGKAFLVHDGKGEERESEDALIEIRGDAANEILTLLTKGPKNPEVYWGDTAGRRGEEIACIGPSGSEPARCALVMKFREGSFTQAGNPLF